MGLPHYAVPNPQPDKRTSSSIPDADVRITPTIEDRTIGNEHALRGIPVAGIGGGAITGTRPGDSTYILERDEAHIRTTKDRKRYKR